MSVGPGQSLLHYRIVERIGEGGMGVVWKAIDTRLGRDVAIKLLPESLATDPQRLARFQREARAMASLNHPNIVTIHGAEQDGTTPFLVMEYVRGTTLAQSIPPGGLPLRRLLDLAGSLAEGLAEAHRNGVTHRDLKPGNVVVTADGRPKILDFGLAKLIADDAPAATHAANGATRTTVTPATAEGTVLGTTGYMSPEQIDGHAVDGRSDIFSFGVMLYEMASGKPPFQGQSAARVMSAILTATPRPLGDMRSDLPARFAAIVQRCLEKEPERRFQTAADLSAELRAVQGELSLATSISAGDTSRRAAPGVARRSAPRWSLGLAAVTVIAIAFAAWIAGNRRGEGRDAGAGQAGAPAVAARLLEQLTFDAATEQWPAWSPDGTRIVYCRDVGGHSKLFVKALGAPGDETVRQLTHGPRDDIQPAWSPDGTTVVFVRSNTERGTLEPYEALSATYDGGDVWSVALDGSAEARLIEEAFNPAFSLDGTSLAVDASWAGPRRIWTTDARGRNPRQITTEASEAIEHTNPAWSPDGSRIVYSHAEKTKRDIHAVDLSGGEVAAVTDDLYLDLDPVWSASGHVVMASYRGGGLNIWRVPVGPDGRPAGAAEQLTTGAGQDIQPALAPDGQRLAFTVLLQNADLWRLPTDPATGAATGPPQPLVASTREDSRGAWSPDGTQVAFNSDRDGEMNLWVHTIADGTTRHLTRGAGGDYQPAWSPDGSQIAFFSTRSGNADVWVVDVASGDLRQITDHPALDTNPFFSPDGSRIAFQSDRDGRKEVWLTDVAGRTAWQLTTVGAGDHFMRWSDDSRQVYFRSSTLPENVVCRVPAEGGVAEPLPLPVGWHMSFSPDRSLVLDAVGHKGLWVYPVDGTARREVFVSEDPEVRVDYPNWSPDGRSVVFDRVAPRGGDVWLLAGLR